MLKNTGSQVVGAQMISATDGSAFTSAVTAYVTIDGGTQAQGSVSSGACTHEGNGFHTYAPSQGETNGDHVAFTFIGSGAVPVTVQIYTRLATPAVNVTQIGGSAVTSASGIPEVKVASIADNAITAAAIATDAIDADALKADAATEIADALLNRDMSAVSDTTARSPLNALRVLRNKVSIAAGTMTVTKENDATAAWTADVTTAAGDPIDSVDPA